MNACKYLIVNNVFRMSCSVEYHSELLPSKRDGIVISGGGRFLIDKDSKSFFIYGSSHEFKTPSLDEVISALNNSILSETLLGYRFYISFREYLSDARAEYALMTTPHWIYEDL